MKFTRKKTSSDVKKKTLEQMRELRDRFEKEHPDLLKKIRHEVQKQSLYEEERLQEQARETAENGDVPIDRRKNLETVMAFAKNNTGSAEFQAKLKKLLLSSLH